MSATCGDAEAMPPKPLDPEKPVKSTPAEVGEEVPHPPQPVYAEDSATTKAEKVERHELMNGDRSEGGVEESPAKRIKLEFEGDGGRLETPGERQRGVAPIKAE